MSHLVGRILLCMFMFPLAVVVYCATLLSLDRMDYRDHGYFLIAGIVTWVFIAIYWTLLWRNSVHWTATRVVRSLLAAGGGLFVGVAGFFFLLNTYNYEPHQILLGILIPTLWLVATVFLWRESPAERASRLNRTGRTTPSCPVCGYNLTGLGESRCPECGSKFTLDELIAAQPGQAAGEIE